MEDITATLDVLCTRLTSLYLQADHIHEETPPEIYEVSELDRLPAVLLDACNIVERAQSLALLAQKNDGNQDL